MVNQQRHHLITTWRPNFRHDNFSHALCSCPRLIDTTRRRLNACHTDLLSNLFSVHPSMRDMLRQTSRGARRSCPCISGSFAGMTCDKCQGLPIPLQSTPTISRSSKQSNTNTLHRTVAYHIIACILPDAPQKPRSPMPSRCS